MNSPSAAPRPRDLQRAPSRPDDRPLATNQIQDAAPAICRICRGEGTASEPLFYPCKCSGSIKYVHQDCLMEWLSHSQKKYCELCKTSFRFTKLYAPDMPQSLPLHVFLEHMTKYLFRNILVWLRAIVAISVWICWLPYFMRSVWSFMFWVSDEGLVNNSTLGNHIIGNVAGTSSSLQGSEACPANPLLAPTTSSVLESSSILKGNTTQHVADFLVRFVLGSLGIPSRVIWPDATSQQGSPSALGPNGQSQNYMSGTLLSDVGFIRNITGSTTVHRSVVSVLEGQLITVLVILSFILIILVRDYVIQQQPDANLRGPFPAAEDPLPPQQEQPGARAEDVPNLRGPDESDSDEETLDDGREREASTDHNEDPAEDGVSDPLPSQAEAAASLDNDPRNPFADPYSPTILPPESRDNVSEEGFVAMDRSAGNSRELMSHFGEGDDFGARHAHHDVEHADEERRDDDVVDFTNIFPNRRLRFDTLQVPPVPPEEPRMDSSSSQDHEAESHDGSAEQFADSKGKGRAESPRPPSEEFEDSSNGSLVEIVPSTSRRRAASDGPQPLESANPLRNNNWYIADSTNEASTTGARAFPSHSEGLTARRNPPPRSLRQLEPYQPDVLHDFGHEERRDSDPEPETHDNALDQVSERAETSDQDIDGAPKTPEEEEPATLVGRVTNFMWGDLEPDLEENMAAEDAGDEDIDDAWVDVPDNDAEADEDADGEDMDGAGGEVGLDAEAMDDLDDFDGIMELIGMRGPIAGLFQNAIFCSVLVSVTIFACIFVPYNIGRVSVWLLANPIMVIRMVFEFSKLVQDAAILFVGAVLAGMFYISRALLFFLGETVTKMLYSAQLTSFSLYRSSGSRIVGFMLKDFPMSASEMQNFSAISHESLITIQNHVASAMSATRDLLATVFQYESLSVSAVVAGTKWMYGNIAALAAVLLDPSSWVIDLSVPDSPTPVNPELAHWSGLDRFWAIFAGYITVFCIGALYLKRGTPFSRSSFLQAWETGVIETLHQASGIIKVILIISIEMLIFPLYCGLLLDFALLPLFEDATLASRMEFTYNYPLTSIFVHWFVGTGYMFHFALFVSMCRKIMRPGVLYFIRDPDDPEFHPVRDVLERNLMTQLRKILFSAFVYGALVIICLGGVVWGLAYLMPGVLPIHYSSNEPVLEFPVDLLFYNFLMPLAIKVLRPSDGLHRMYTWWFRRLGRGLRLTYFLFGDRRIDEEGTLQLAAKSRHHDDYWYRRYFLELDEPSNKVIPKTWRDFFDGGDLKPNTQVSGQHMKLLRRRKTELVETGQLVRSGRFVRAPASDRVKIPKGKKVFLTVTERDYRRDERPDDDLYASNQYQVVYIPPYFRARIFLFILSIWIFAAVTGVGLTIVPLMFGRLIFQALIPEHIRTNDIYAFSIGIYLLGSAVYMMFHMKRIAAKVPNMMKQMRDGAKAKDGGARLLSLAVRGGTLFYAYFFLVLVFPLLVSAVIELYVVIPLHTYLHPPKVAPLETALGGASETDPSRHNVRIIQAWTLGILYLKLGSRMITSLIPESRLAVAVRTVLRRGWLRPDISVLTRAFVVPGLALTAAAIFIPPSVTAFLIKNDVFSNGEAVVNQAAEAARIAVIYRRSYPVAAFAALLLRHAIGIVKIINGWTARIRDEAYLIGERLHNFGAGPTSPRKNTRGAWRAGGPRL